jgi:hypothetical protein
MTKIPQPDRSNKRGPVDPMAREPVIYKLPDEAARLFGGSHLVIELPVGVLNARLPAQDPSLTLEARLEAMEAEFKRYTAAARQRVMAENGPDPEEPALWWKGESYPLQLTPYRLLCVMWYRDSISIRDHLLAQWWEEIEPPSKDALKNACRGVNKVLSQLPGFTRGVLGLKDQRVVWKS